MNDGLATRSGAGGVRVTLSVVLSRTCGEKIVPNFGPLKTGDSTFVLATGVWIDMSDVGLTRWLATAYSM